MAILDGLILKETKTSMKKNSLSFAANMTQALLSLKLDEEVHHFILSQLQGTLMAMQSGADMGLFLTSPTLTIQDKMAIFKKEKFVPATCAVLQTLLETGYIMALNAVIQSYRQALTLKQKHVNGIIYVAHKEDISKKSLEALKKKLSQKIMGHLYLEVKESPILEAGFVVDMGDLYLDGSLGKTLSDISILGER